MARPGLTANIAKLSTYPALPSDVVDVVVFVLCRMIFDFAVWSPRPVKVAILLFAKRRIDMHLEATRCIPAYKRPLARMAKEGRKYDVSLGLVSQRPSELNETILSQCNTLIVLRMSNEQDQTFVQRALPDAVRSLVKVLPTLCAPESLIVGKELKSLFALDSVTRKSGALTVPTAICGAMERKYSQ